MAEKRMFAKAIVQSSRFLKMPVSSRELYFQLGMSADDDGVVEAWNIMKITNAREDDLRVLVAKGYVQILDNEDMVAYLTDWETNNTIRKDRYHQGAYKDLKLQVLEMGVNQLSTKCQPSDNQVTTEVSIGKVSKDKDSIYTQAKRIFDMYNSKCPSLPRARSLSDKRIKLIKSLLNKFSEKDIETVFTMAENSNFLKGNGRDWSADFEWLINSNNVVKVLEGKYDNKEKEKHIDKNAHQRQTYDFEALQKMLEG